MPIPSVAGIPPPFFVGRERELDILRDRLAAAIAALGSLVLIGGEAGIGKTALAESLCREAAEQGALVLIGRCYDLTETPPYGPWLELFARYQPSGALPPLPPAFAARGTIGAVASQATLFTQALDFLIAVARQRPLVLLLDDLHWADPASLDLLRVVARNLADDAVLLAVTYRTDELTRRHPLYALLPLLERETGATRLDLRRLSLDAVQSHVVARYHLRDAEAVRLAAYLHERTEGNALFLQQLLRALEEDAIIQVRDGDWKVDDLTRVGVPMPLRQVIDARVRRLGEEGQRLLGVASVIGQEVPVSLWAAVAATDEETILDLIDRAGETQILEETPDGAGVRFAHALIREALYEGIPASRRRRMHTQVGEMVAALPAPDPDTVAYHFQQAGDARASAWLVRAGERAHRLWAWPAAATRYEAALALMEQTAAMAEERGWLLFRLGQVGMYYNTEQGIASLEEAGRLAVTAEDHLLVANSLFRLGALRYLRGDIRRGLADMEAGFSALRALSPTEGARLRTLAIHGLVDEEHARGWLLNNLANTGRFAAADALADGSNLPSAGTRVATPGHGDRGIALTHASFGRPEEAHRAYGIARDTFRTAGNDLEAGLTALDELSYVALPYQTDDLRGRRQLATEAERLYVLTNDHQTRLPTERGRLPLMVVEGDWADARAVGLAVVAVGGHGGYLSRAQRALGPLAREQGDVNLAGRLVREMLPAGPATAPGDAAWFVDVLVMLRLAAALATDAGNFEAARSWLASHDAWLAWGGCILGQADGSIGWAAYYRGIGDLEAAYGYATQAQKHATEPRQPLALIAAHRLLGELDTETGRFDQAADHLNASLTLATACHAPYERALTLLAQAELRAAIRETAEV